ncbi:MULTISPECIES: glycine zipper 2TM domain-containing protein [unclassified Sphingomonas]|uniref:glycine zipper 2TM domain-containing protein n=1 Tax=unclassified Sphingomonas TaxID=196159 RepID=UPI001F56BC3C|nr:MULTISPECIES: glycine zipper 2TM domain-containing protein [unclassified Sphingomonas]
MFKTLSLAGAALLVSATALAPAAADAQRYGGYDRGYSQGYDNGYGRGGYSNYNGYDGYRDNGRGSYRGDARGYARCNNGTGGTIIGAIAGGLLGRTIDTRGDRTLGTVLGAGAGALAGNAIGRSGNPGYCRR